MKHLASFSFRNVTALILAATNLYALGCGADGGEAPVDPNLFNVGMEGAAGEPNTGNGLDYTCVMDHGVQASVRSLGGARLSSALLDTLPSMPYMPAGTAGGTLAGCRREFLKDLVECALEEDGSVKDANDPITILGTSVARTYYGQIGLAPDWETRALTTDEKELVTACIMARTNRFGEEIDILLQGSDDPIAYDYYLRTQYAYVESTVWGNMFDSTVTLNPTHDPSLPTERPFNGYVCENFATETCADAAFRVCDEGDSCGFIDKGACSLVNCMGMAGGAVPSGCEAWDNKITIYLSDHADVCPIPNGP